MSTSDEIYQRLQQAYVPYRTATTDTDLLSLAFIKALCTEVAPTAVKVVCDITDQGGDTLVFSWLEDAAGEHLEVEDGVQDQLSEALSNLHYEQVENEGSRRMPQPIIRLDGEFPLPPTPPVLYQKCRDCHLFVEPNDVDVEDGIAPYVHLHRGDDADEAIEESHQAQPSGLLATLDVWKQFGPPAMRVRFTDLPKRMVMVGFAGEYHGFPVSDEAPNDNAWLVDDFLKHAAVDIITDTLEESS